MEGVSRKEGDRLKVGDRRKRGMYLKEWQEQDRKARHRSRSRNIGVGSKNVGVGSRNIGVEVGTLE